MLFRRLAGRWVPLGQSWGPQGRAAPHTPAYSTPATAFASDITSLQAALNAASAGGVIEVSSNLVGSPILTGGNASWATNVLIRPPIGSRLSTDSFNIKARCVTVAGFDVSSGGLVRNTAEDGSGFRSGFWRCVGTGPSVSWFLTGVTDGFLCEVVSAKRSFNEDEDRVDAYSLATGFDLVRAVIDGCYFAGQFRGVTNPALATFAQVAPFTVGQTIGSYTATGSSTVTCVMSAVPNIAAGATITVDIRKNGTIVSTQTIPKLSNTNFINDYLQDPTLSIGLVASDVLSATVQAISGTVPSLTMSFGIPSIGHVDTLQFAHGTGGLNDSFTVRNSVIQGSSNSALQNETNNVGDCVLANNWWGTDANSSINIAKTVTASTRYHLYRNYFIKDPLLNSSSLGLCLSNRLTGFGWIDAPIVVDPSNIVDSNMAKILPGVPDLTVVWPECPFTGDPT